MAPLEVQFRTTDVWEQLDLAAAWEDDWKLFRASDQVELVERFRSAAPFPVEVRRIASSPEGWPIQSVAFGNPQGRRVLVWARQHGDEPECTAALMTVLHRFANHSATDPIAARILDGCRFLVVPMVNPDGVEAFTRANALGIDLNRDARNQATSEGRALVAMQREFDPEFAFNLHDMRPRRTTAEADPDIVAIAFQSCPFDEASSDNPQRLKAKAVIAEMLEAVGAKTRHVARYKSEFLSRGFGDAMMAWGVSSILIESGSATRAEGGDDFAARLHALALLCGLNAIASRADERADARLYETIPLDEGTFDFDGLLKGGELLDVRTGLTVRSDAGWQTESADVRVDEQRQFIGRMVGVGDLYAESSTETWDVDGCLVTPGIAVVSDSEALEEESRLHELVRVGVTVVVSPSSRATALRERFGVRPPVTFVFVADDSHAALAKRFAAICPKPEPASVLRSFAEKKKAHVALHADVVRAFGALRLCSLRPGCQADIVVWDPKTNEPRHVFVNGGAAVLDGAAMTPHPWGRWLFVSGSPA